MRTGVKVPGNKVGLTKIRKIKKSSRKIDWRETRVAFARPVEDKNQRTFVARMGKYSEVIQQLVGAAYDRGGEIESAHRYIPQKRLKISGATWHPDSINPMLALRIIRANDWWSEFWSGARQQRGA